ncbi:hypothetical protein LTR27_008679 [Elasticomyces elasticus]|nr:hypothetical protein LTR27_008679 [Elasticomyces elasticus]
MSTSTKSESTGGFGSFWRRSNKSLTPNVQFVQQDPSTKETTSRLGRLFTHSSSTSADGGPSESSDHATAATKRRQQVVQAQKRHRYRKGEYVQALEAEVARLQHLDAIVNSEKSSLVQENEAMRALLATHPVETRLDATQLSTSFEDVNSTGSSMVDVRYDSVIAHERVFLDFGNTLETSWPPATTSQSWTSTPPGQSTAKSTETGDAWAALDFILALEWPCRDHVKHNVINPTAKIPKACDVGGFHGHALTTTQAVYQHALPVSGTSQVQSDNDDPHPSTSQGWHLPHSEIDKLVQLSQQLDLDDEQLTPAMAYAAIKQELPSNEFLKPVLEALKIPLANLVQCSGLGAWMPATDFFQCLHVALGGLNQNGFGSACP